jgi:hypothetical protein
MASTRPALWISLLLLVLGARRPPPPRPAFWPPPPRAQAWVPQPARLLAGHTAALSRDGARLWVADGDTVEALQLPEGTSLGRWTPVPGQRVVRVAVSPDHLRSAAQLSDRTVFIWRDGQPVPDERPTGIPNDEGSGYEDVRSAYTPISLYIEDDGTIGALWEGHHVEGCVPEVLPKTLHHHQAPPGEPWRRAPLPDPTEDQPWDRSPAGPPRRQTSHGEVARSTSLDGTQALIRVDHRFNLRDSRAEAALWWETLPHRTPGPPASGSISLAPNGACLLVPVGDQLIAWSLQSGQRTTLPLPARFNPATVSWSRDGAWVRLTFAARIPPEDRVHAIDPVSRCPRPDPVDPAAAAHTIWLEADLAPLDSDVHLSSRQLLHKIDRAADALGVEGPTLSRSGLKPILNASHVEMAAAANGAVAWRDDAGRVWVATDDGVPPRWVTGPAREPKSAWFSSGEEVPLLLFGVHPSTAPPEMRRGSPPSRPPQPPVLLRPVRRLGEDPDGRVAALVDPDGVVWLHRDGSPDAFLALFVSPEAG